MTAAANAVKSEVEKQAEELGQSMKLYEIEEGRKQVVAGMNYKIKIKIDKDRYCEIKVFRSLPPISYQLKSVTFIGDMSKKPMPLGGWKKAEKKELQDAANAVKSDVEKKAKEDKQAALTKYEVMGGSKQVVAGMNFKIRIKVGEKRFIEIVVYRSLPPIKYELKSVSY